MVLKIDNIRKNFKSLILKAAQSYDISNIRVFGSFATGKTHSASDLDLLVKLNKRTSLLKLAALQNQLSAAIGLPVQIVSENGINPLIKNRIFEEAVPL